MPASGRDRRLVAVHRGGELTRADHRLLAGWAGDCADRVLPLFAVARPGDARPPDAVRAARAWAAGGLSVSAARAAAAQAHAAAREVSGAAQLAARASGHAAATAHMADHALVAADYALLALRAADGTPDLLDAERRWQLESLPAPVAELVRAGMEARTAVPRGLLSRTRDDSEGE